MLGLKDIHHLDRVPYEQAHNKLYVLGVSELSSNVATRAELGRYPMTIDIATLTIKYWQNLIVSPDKLLFKAYKEKLENDKAGV